jgi:hypothetical protein
VLFRSLTAGVHEVRVRAIGYLPKTLTFEVSDGMKLPVALTLDPDPAAAVP